MILKNNQVTVDEEEYFENLIKLVEVSAMIIIPWCCHCVACVQHYQKEADGLCTRLRTPVDKEGKHDVRIDLEA